MDLLRLPCFNLTYLCVGPPHYYVKRDIRLFPPLDLLGVMITTFISLGTRQ